MKFKSKQILLKDGKQVILRAPCTADASLLIAFLKDVYTQTPYLMRYPEEVAITEEAEIEIIQNTLLSLDHLMIIAEIDGQIAGNCEISFNQKIKIRHRADVAISIRQEYWGLGLGTALFQELLTAAKNHPEVRQVELEFIEGNERAYRLYRKMGFEIVASHPDAIRLKDGTMLKIYLMIKYL